MEIIILFVAFACRSLTLSSRTSVFLVFFSGQLFSNVSFSGIEQYVNDYNDDVNDNAVAT